MSQSRDARPHHISLCGHLPPCQSWRFLSFPGSRDVCAFRPRQEPASNRRRILEPLLEERQIDIAAGNNAYDRPWQRYRAGMCQQPGNRGGASRFRH